MHHITSLDEATKAVPSSVTDPHLRVVSPKNASSIDATVLVADPNILTEENVVSLLTLCRKFQFLQHSLGLTNTVSSYLLMCGTSGSHRIPFLDFHRLLGAEDNDELFHLVICIGACQCGEKQDAIKLFNLAWKIIVEKVSNKAINYHSSNFQDFARNVIVLCYIYLNYLANFQNYDGLREPIVITIEALFEYLNSIITTQLENSAKKSGGNLYTVDPLYWYAYTLLSEHCFISNITPFSLHWILSDKVLPVEKYSGDKGMGQTLADLTAGISVSSCLFYGTKRDVRFKYALGFKEQILVCSLLNELQSLKYASLSTKQSHCIFSGDQDSLHNAIILANKALNYEYNSAENEKVGPTSVKSSSSDSAIGQLNGGMEQGPEEVSEGYYRLVMNDKYVNNQNYSQFANLLILSKRRLLISCPRKYSDLISYYIFLPKDSYNWVLLGLTIKEFLLDVDSHFAFKSEFKNGAYAVGLLLDSNLAAPSNNSQAIFEYLHSSFSADLVVKNNLAITILPMLFLSLILGNGNLTAHRLFLNLPLNLTFVAEMVMSSFLITMRLFIYHRTGLVQGHQHFGATYPSSQSSVVSMILYMIKEMGRNVDSFFETMKLPGGQRRYSIMVGDLMHNKRNYSSRHSVGQEEEEEEELEVSLVDDDKFLFYMKNLELSFISWLDLLSSCGVKTDTFKNNLSSALQEVYRDVIFAGRGSIPPSVKSTPPFSNDARNGPVDFFHQANKRQRHSALFEKRYVPHSHFKQDIFSTTSPQRFDFGMDPKSTPLSQHEEREQIKLPPIISPRVD